MALSLGKRPCNLGGHINVRSETHGDSTVLAADLTIDGIMLEQDELCDLLGDEHAAKALFNTSEA
jgi:hypothetical protein